MCLQCDATYRREMKGDKYFHGDILDAAQMEKIPPMKIDTSPSPAPEDDQK